MMRFIYASNKVELGPPNLLEGRMKNEKWPSTATEENFLFFSPSHEKNLGREDDEIHPKVTESFSYLKSQKQIYSL